MLTTSMSTLALPLALNVISTQAFSAPLQDGLQQPPAFRSFQLEARSKSYPSPLITRDPNHTTATLINITNESDMEYVAKVSVGGQEIILAVDTGSSDLWVHTPYQLNITSQTDIAINLSYGIGSASGQVVYGPMYLGAFFVPEQVFLKVDKVEQQSGEGILGLGLASLSSIYNQANKTRMAQPAIYNIFDQNTTSSNFVALSIERSGDMERTSGGILSINEYDPRFAIVENSPKLPLAPTNSSRWTIAMDTLHMNGQYYNLTSQVQGAALNTSIALIDSGTSLAYVPVSAVDFIYGGIEGAVHLQDSGKNVWVVPCLEPANLTISFGGTSFPIDPLELTTLQTVVENGQKWTVCVNAIQSQLDVGSGDLDYLLGDLFMRNVYSVFNFGDISLYNNTTESASIQLISRTNQSQSYRDFVAKRNTTLRSRPPLYDIKRLNQSSDGGQWIVGLSSHNADTGTQSFATTQMQMLDAHNQLIRIGVD